MSNWPRFSRKEVRQFVEWLDDQGWQYGGEDTNGHVICTFPGVDGTLLLPETPKGNMWLTRINQLMGAGRGHF